MKNYMDPYRIRWRTSLKFGSSGPPLRSLHWNAKKSARNLMLARPKYLLDTSVYSQPLRRAPMMPALRRWDEAGDKRCVISIVCRAETEWGLLKSPDQRRDHRYESLLRDRLVVLKSDAECWSLFSSMKARQVLIGRIVGDLDLLIAATARRHDCIVATLNPSDFSKIEGIRWEDWSV